MRTPTTHFDAVADQTLMLLVKRGDERAYEALVERHRSAVASVARFTCGPDLADDVTQVALVSLWQHSDKYHPDRGTPRSWLLGIARNRGIDHIRSHAARQRHLVALDPEGWIGIADAGEAARPADEQIEQAESRAELRRLMLGLPPAQRRVIELAYFEELSQQEIASQLGLPVGTVKGRLRLGLKKLRRGLRAGTEPQLLAA